MLFAVDTAGQVAQVKPHHQPVECSTAADVLKDVVTSDSTYVGQAGSCFRCSLPVQAFWQVMLTDAGFECRFFAGFLCTLRLLRQASSLMPLLMSEERRVFPVLKCVPRLCLLHDLLLHHCTTLTKLLDQAGNPHSHGGPGQIRPTRICYSFSVK